MIIVRHSEIYTKSKPVRRRFIDRLTHNIRIALPKAKVIPKKWRIYVEGADKDSKKLEKVFGVASFSVAQECAADFNAIKKLAGKVKVKSPFAVRTKRLAKEFPMTSQEINEKIGAFVQKRTKAKVNLEKPKTTIHIEIYGKKAHVFGEVFDGPGGLPTGTAGEVTVLLKNKDSVKAALMMMKRGVKMNALGDKKLVKELQKWSCGHNIKLVDDIQGPGVVTGTRSAAEFAKLEKKYDMPVYAPLIGL